MRKNARCVPVWIRLVLFCSRTAPTASPHCNACTASAAAATSAWPTDVALNLPLFTPTSSEPEDSANLLATDAVKVGAHTKKRRRSSDDASSAAFQPSSRLEKHARAPGGLSGGLAQPTAITSTPSGSFCGPAQPQAHTAANPTWQAGGGRLPSKAWHQPVRCTPINAYARKLMLLYVDKSRRLGHAILPQVAQHANRGPSAGKKPSFVASSTGLKSPASPEMPRKPQSPNQSTDELPLQCPIRKCQGKVRDGSLRCQLAKPRYRAWHLISAL